MTDALQRSRKKLLAEAEADIEKNLLSFVVVGLRLKQIRDGKLFKESDPPYNDFPEYCEYRWGQELSHAYRLINAAHIRGSLQENSPNGELLPIQETQLRPLSKLGTERRPADEDWLDAWEKACKRSHPEPPTEKQVKQVVDAIIKARKAAGLPDPSGWDGQDGIFVGDANSSEFLDALPEDAFDMVLTDPPWEEASINAYVSVGKIALKSLRPGGVCAVYFGKIYLPEVIGAVNEYLDYEWTFSLYYPESQVRIRKAAVYDCWRPVGIFRKPGEFSLPPFSRDALPSPREKDVHRWQQAIGPARELVKRYTSEGSIVLDPFVGGGTFPLAAKVEKRRYLAFDKDPDTVKLATERVRRG